MLVDAFPTTITGKVQKYLIRRPWSTNMGLQEQRTA
jgi:fatty-acyl-CoA synthase